jgi:D-beta-D-heptose 7-phosphate kinase / D-beta-D-heptose 1-phosphate adenosyltransferase
MSRRILVVGDALLDRDVEGRVDRLCPDAPVPVLDEAETRSRPGGAGLAAALIAAEGDPVTLVTALAPDPAGGELARALLDAGVDLVDLGLDGRTPEKIRLLAGRSLLRLDRGGSGRVRAEGVVPALHATLGDAAAILVSDYGRGVAAHPEAREVLESAAAQTPLVWDPHPRGPAPVAGAAVVTPNLAEAVGFDEGDGEPRGEVQLAGLARHLASSWRVDAVCVTRGNEGALLADAAGSMVGFPASSATGDPCGAGDRFAAAVAQRLAAGETREDAIRAAVRAATEFVRQGGAGRAVLCRRCAVEGGGSASGPASFAPALALAERVRREGGAVAATGGCFDLLHLGHVRGLEAAARLGDCLVVLLNSDRSVRTLKGSDRPLVGELDRAAMLKALACVDEVAIFDQPTPRRALRLLQPDVWAKGGDYDLDQLPENEEVAAWGGRTAILPYLEGRSTTKLIEEANARVAA